MIEFSFAYTSIILVLMTVLLVKEVFEPDIVIFSTLIILTIGNVIDVKEALIGFSNSGMLTVGFLFIVAEALTQTGVLNDLGSWLLGKKDNKTITYKLLRFLFPVSVLSAFFNNTPIVAMLLGKKK